MSESKDQVSKDVNPKEEILVDAPEGAEAFAATEGHDSHHSFVGVEKESIDVKLVMGLILGTVVIVIALVTIGFTVTEVTARETNELIISQTEYPELREVRAAAANRLTQYDIIPGVEGKFQIPIDQAINLMANEAHQNRGQRAYSDELVLLPAQ
jgi:hypothetical protein